MKRAEVPQNLHEWQCQTLQPGNWKTNAGFDAKSDLGDIHEYQPNTKDFSPKHKIVRTGLSSETPKDIPSSQTLLD